MKRTITLLASLLSTTLLSNAQVVISDNYDVVGNGTGFGNNTGVNTDIATRLTGTASPGLSYINMNVKPGTLFSITDNKLQGNGNNQIAAFTLSGDGINAFDFASALGSTTATPANPAKYEVALKMANNLTGGPRFSFGFMTTTPADGVGSAGLWDFGIQLDRATDTTAYDVFGRIDESSLPVVGDANFLIQGMGANSYGTEVSVVLRITDAGAETDGFNSKVEVSLDGGNSFIYSTADGEFRFDGSDRFFMWDFASNGGSGNRGFGTYDDFAVTLTPVPEPSTFALAGLGGAALLFMRRRFTKSAK